MAVFEAMDEARRLRDDIARLVEGPVADPVDTVALVCLVNQLVAVQAELEAHY